MTTPVTIDCPYCSAELTTTVEDFKAGVPLDCKVCGKRTDTNPLIASFELQLKWPKVFLKDDGADE